MHCSEWERLLDAHLDGQLSGSLRLEFDAHRLHCPRCQQIVAMMETISTVITADEPPQLSLDFADRVMARIESAPAPAPWYRRPRVLAGLGAMNAVAAALLVFVILPRVGSPGGSSPPSDASMGALDPRTIDPIDLADYIWARAEAARRGVSSDLSQLAQIPLGLSLPDGMSATGLSGMLDILVPGATTAAPPAAEDDSTHAL
ncbi:MAG: zf-HC2 domain-containing protein [Planctomycetia bacterium]|nr:MAG: zf-HC2 domain-containing protein [Planctomycetia bacterium]